MQNKSRKIGRHCGRGPAIQAVYKEKTTLLNRLDPGSMSGMTARKAFTLIELLVVVLIIGILAAVAVPQYQKSVEKTRLTEALILGKHIQQLEQVYHLANGTYTNSFVELGLDIPSGYNVIPSVPYQLNLQGSATHFTLETGDNKRAIYYYYSGSSLDLALFFNFSGKRPIDCLGYTDWGSKLCAALPL